MKKLKLACWNVEWMDDLWPDLKSKYHIDRRTHVANEINEIGADVMCIEEGTSKSANMSQGLIWWGLVAFWHILKFRLSFTKNAVF